MPPGGQNIVALLFTVPNTKPILAATRYTTTKPADLRMNGTVSLTFNVQAYTSPLQTYGFLSL
jgi:hypothetical protein